jgi:hypothetical protein
VCVLTAPRSLRFPLPWDCVIFVTDIRLRPCCLRRCQKQFAQYTCPRCNSRYCSLTCYKVRSTPVPCVPHARCLPESSWNSVREIFALWFGYAHEVFVQLPQCSCELLEEAILRKSG